jgi:hypothetical protein
MRYIPTCPPSPCGIPTGDPAILQSVSSTSWPPLYYNNPIVKQSETPVVPLALYLDGVPSTKRDGILGFWLYSLVTFKRHLICVLRKSQLCRCGCKGWCSLHAVWAFLIWSLRAMSAGVFPSARHDHILWQPADTDRAAKGGNRLEFKCMLLQIRGDWLEFCSSMGFALWSHNVCPCPFCDARKDQLANFAGFSPVSSSFRCVTAAQYNEACNACEHRRTLSRAEHAMVKNALEYNKTRDGPRGRALMCDMPLFNLLKGDRLEPDENVQDIGEAFDSATEFPLRVTFWRRNVFNRVGHRCAIFDEALGISLDTMCVDSLHCLYLGPAKDWCCAVLWALIDFNVYRFDGAVDQRIQLTTNRIRTELWAFYRRYKHNHPEEDVTQLEDLTPGMLGTSAKRKLSAKAMETKCLIPFCLELMTTHVAAIGSVADKYIGIGECFIRLADVLKQEKFVVRPTALQEMYNSTTRLFKLWVLVELHIKPKLHMMMHLVDRTLAQGNPAYYATWVDEGLNKVLASLGRQAHRSVWEARILTYFEHTEDLRQKRRRF